jgi:23S rRNA (guanosine2251-2'-O)-methyltransferase
MGAHPAARLMAAAPYRVNAHGHAKRRAPRQPLSRKQTAAYKPAMPRNHQRPPSEGRRPHNRFQSRSPAERRPESLWIYGIHPVLAALANPRRKVLRLLATPNALARLNESGASPSVPPEETTPKLLDRLLGGEAVHQGAAIEVAPLPPIGLDELTQARLVVVLDQITDPHNVGAILRSSVAFAADAVVTTGRHSAAETGVLAKAASGALDAIPLIEVQNLARALEELGRIGFTRIGLDSEAESPIEEAMAGGRIALVLGAEGRGLRRLTRDTCDRLARLTVPGAIASLNVSNAAVLALYLARRALSASS